MKRPIDWPRVVGYVLLFAGLGLAVGLLLMMGWAAGEG